MRPSAQLRIAWALDGIFNAQSFVA